MTGLRCYVGDMRDVGGPTIDALQLKDPSWKQAQSVGALFRQASGNAGLDVALDWSRRESVAHIPHIGPIAVSHLSDALDLLLAGPVGQPAVGLLLANYLDQNLSLYGAMFDLDWHHGDVGPRQGCAIFVNAIQDALYNAGRADDPQSLNEFLAYTAVHEIGHALNLWHVEGTFMRPHPDPAALSPYEFAQAHKDYLALAADPANARFVLPGAGGSPYGERPSGWGNVDNSNPYAGPARDPPQLSLDIRLSHGAFYAFEPVELDIAVSLPAGVRRAKKVPDEFDPGYERFQIWITEPSGERRRYRSTVRFCGSHGQRVISTKNPYGRDISIFRQAGRFTFAAPGRYRVEVAYRTPRAVVWSNALSCEIRHAAPDSDAWRIGRTLLASREGSNLLRYKATAPSANTYAALVDYARQHASPETAAAVHYALGKSLLASTRRAAPSTHVQKIHRRGLQHLEQADRSRTLGRHRRQTVETLLAAQ